MSRNRSLDEFATGEDTEGSGDGDADAVDPIASTYDRSPGGAPCGSCGALVEERWRDGDDLVCTDCKEW